MNREPRLGLLIEGGEKGLSRATRLGRPWKRERWRGGKIEGGIHGPCFIHTPCSIF